MLLDVLIDKNISREYPSKKVLLNWLCWVIYHVSKAFLFCIDDLGFFGIF